MLKLSSSRTLTLNFTPRGVYTRGRGGNDSGFGLGAGGGYIDFNQLYKAWVQTSSINVDKLDTRLETVSYWSLS